jgi:protein TonB
VLPEGTRSGRALPISIAIHALVGLALVLVPLFWPDDPMASAASPVLFFNPPAAAAAPLALGAETAKAQPVKPQPKTEIQKPTVKPPDPEFVVPRETKPIEPETSAPVPETQGSSEGVVGGSSEGMVGGVEGGLPGGVLGGQVGGVPWGTGDAVADYDQQPRLVRQTRPAYPQEAFIKKIEGTVMVEILIDVTGRVMRARVVESIPSLDKAALDCVYQWVFTPAMKRGQPVASVAAAPVTFRIY